MREGFEEGMMCSDLEAVNVSYPSQSMVMATFVSLSQGFLPFPIRFRPGAVASMSDDAHPARRHLGDTMVTNAAGEPLRAPIAHAVHVADGEEEHRPKREARPYEEHPRRIGDVAAAPKRVRHVLGIGIREHQ